MAQRNAKDEIVTFKADASLLNALRGVPNRSAFIRSAVLAALDSTCPLCMGTGNLTPHQRSHWQVLTDDHSLEECNSCHEYHLVCSHHPKVSAHRGESE